MALDDSVAQLLRGSGTRTAALDALDAHSAPIDRSVSLAVAPVLGELLALEAAEVAREQFDRVGLLLARLLAEAASAAEAPDDPASVFGAAFGNGRYAALYAAEDTVLAQAVRKPAAELTLADARSFACWNACGGPYRIRGATEPLLAAGVSSQEW